VAGVQVRGVAVAAGVASGSGGRGAFKRELALNYGRRVVKAG